jgi:hypothetical protein
LEKEDFFQAFKESDSKFDIFILHNRTLIDGTFESYPEFKFTRICHTVMDVIQYSNYHVFIDDFHDYWAKILTITARKELEPIGHYDTTFSSTLVNDVVSSMIERRDREKSPYLWIAFDFSQLTPHSIHPLHYINTSDLTWGLMIRFHRDMLDRLEKYKAESKSLFRSLSKGIRCTADIGDAIERVRLAKSNDLTSNCSYTDGESYDTVIDQPKLYENTGHHIQGLKSVFVLIKNCENQEKLVNKVILDELDLLLKGDSSLSPEDVATIADSFISTRKYDFNGTSLDIPEKLMLKIKEQNYAAVTIRRTIYPSESVQATEWKAVICVLDLKEYIHPE